MHSFYLFKTRKGVINHDYNYLCLISSHKRKRAHQAQTKSKCPQQTRHTRPACCLSPLSKAPQTQTEAGDVLPAGRRGLSFPYSYQNGASSLYRRTCLLVMVRGLLILI